MVEKVIRMIEAQPSKKAELIARIATQPNEPELGYMAKQLITCTLPHRDPGDVLVWKRTNGHSTLALTAHIDTNTGKSIGLPYGSIPRLLLFWITSEAVSTGSRRLVLGNSLTQFFNAVGLSPNTGHGKRSNPKRLREQMSRLFRCKISFDSEKDNSQKWHDMEVAPHGETWWDYSQPDQGSVFESYIILGEYFYEAIRTNPVPVDFRALKALKKSPFALDLYAWATYRAFSLEKTGQKLASITLTGEDSLAEQFGSNYSRADNFKAALSEGLEAVQSVWPEFHYDLTTERLTIHASKVPIAETSSLKKRRQLAELKPGELSIASRIWFLETYPRHDQRAVLKSFKLFLKKNTIKPHDIDALFRDYAAKWVKNEV